MSGVGRTRARVRSSVRAGTKDEMSPPNRAISFTKRDEMNWWVSLAVKNTVSIVWSSR